MGRDDWYRRTTWTAEDRRAFHERLAQSRSAFNKAQYARIQAVHLQEEGLFEGALDLLELVLREFPEPTELAQTFLQIAQCRVATGRLPEALEAYRASLRAEQERPNVRTQVWIEFPWLVVTRQMTDLYAEARDFLAWGKKRDSGFELLINLYQRSVVEAFMADEAGDRLAARQHAQEALDTARVKHSGLSYHPNLGLVKKQTRTVRRRLKKLARPL